MMTLKINRVRRGEGVREGGGGRGGGRERERWELGREK